MSRTPLSSLTILARQRGSRRPGTNRLSVPALLTDCPARSRDQRSVPPFPRPPPAGGSGTPTSNQVARLRQREPGLVHRRRLGGRHPTSVAWRFASGRQPVKPVELVLDRQLID